MNKENLRTAGLAISLALSLASLSKGQESLETLGYRETALPLSAFKRPALTGSLPRLESISLAAPVEVSANEIAPVSFVAVSALNPPNPTSNESGEKASNPTHPEGGRTPSGNSYGATPADFLGSLPVQPRKPFAAIKPLLEKLKTALGMPRSLDSSGVPPEGEASSFQSAVLNPIAHGNLKPLRLRPGVPLAAASLKTKNGVAVSWSHFETPVRELAKKHETLVLDAASLEAGAVEESIRRLLESRPRQFGLEDETGTSILSNENLALVHIQTVSGGPHRADTLHAVFRQIQKGIDENGKPYYLQVYGASLRMTFKIIGGKAVLRSYDGKLFPVQPDMTPNYSNDILQSMAERRLLPATKTGRILDGLRRFFVRPFVRGNPAEPSSPHFLVRQIVPDPEGGWHAANIYQGMDLNGQPVNVGVDVKSGESFAWDAKGAFLRPKTPPPSGSVPVSIQISYDIEGKAVATFLGRGNSLAQGSDHGPIVSMPLAHLKVRNSKGALIGTTDSDGRLALPSGGPTDVSAKLEGKYAVVIDANKKNAPMGVQLRLQPGKNQRGVMTPRGGDAEFVGQVNSYSTWNHLLDWMKSIGIRDERVDEPLTIYNNRSDLPCNAYYDPMSDTLNLERESPDCENTAQPSIQAHESGHRFVQMFSRIDGNRLRALAGCRGHSESAFRFLSQGIDFIMGAGVNEGAADTISMFFRNNPKIGEKFFKFPGPGRPEILRDGRNKKQYKPGEAHDEGEVLMGITWQIFDEFKTLLGEAAGAAYASALIVPTLLLSQPRDISTAVAQILLAAEHKDGKFPHSGIIRKAARDHGILVGGHAP